MIDWIRRLIFGKEGFEIIKTLPKSMERLEKTLEVMESLPETMELLTQTIASKRSPTLSPLDKQQRKLDGIKLGSLKNQIRSLEEALLDRGGSLEGEETVDLQGFSLNNLLSNPEIQKKILALAENPKVMEKLKLAAGGQKQEDWL